MQIRLANESDIPQLKAISETIDSAAHWTQQQWLDIFQSKTPMRLAWIAEENIARTHLQGIGFLIAQNGGSEWELENIAVLPKFRQRGTGSSLLSALLLRARSSGAERILLEVRSSNASAIRLYNLSGFRLLARRPGYYRNPEEDALVLVYPFRN